MVFFLSPPAFSRDGKLLAVGSMQGEVTLLMSATGKEVRRIKSVLPRVDALVFAPDGKTILGRGMGDGALAIWEVESGKLVTTIGKPSDEQQLVRPRPFAGSASGALALSADGKTLLSGEGNVVRLLDLKTGKDLLAALGHAGPVNAVRFESDGKRVTTQSLDGTVRAWDLAGRELSQVRVPDSATSSTL